MCVCVCVCVRERERESGGGVGVKERFGNSLIRKQPDYFTDINLLYRHKPMSLYSEDLSIFLAVGKCYYKGQQYSQGAQWQDGCAYDCECTNAAIGQYQCYNKSVIR